MLGPCGPVNCWFVGGRQGRLPSLAGYWYRPPAGRVGAYRIRPPSAPARGECTSPGMIIHPFRDVWRAYSIRPYPGTRAGAVRRRPRPNFPASAEAVRDACQVYQGRLREFLQVSRHLPWRLRRRRKSLGVCRGVCAGGAGSLGICRGGCASGASLSAFAAAFAQAAQVSRRLSRPGFLTALPRAGRWGVCWASSRRPTRGERRRRGLHSARSAGC